MEGNIGGFAVGQATFATELTGGDSPDDQNYLWEGWCSFRLTNHIALTPAKFYLSRPFGQPTLSSVFSQIGGLLRATFSF